MTIPKTAGRVSIERDGAVAVIRMRAGRANAMSAEMLSLMSDAVEEVRASDAEAAVFTGDGRFFSAGLALPDLIDLDRADMASFMRSVDAGMKDILTLPIPTIAAIDGPAIAGGCVLALMCDLRVMSSSARWIGLTEVRLSIGLPAMVVEALRFRVPASSLTPIALVGELWSPDDALGLGLVDEVTEPSGVVDRAIARAGSLAGSPVAFAQIKSSLLRPVVAEIERCGESELDSWLETWFSTAGQAQVRSVVAALRR
ncbi:MAG: enoyl-CoA hydratase/isomerase family protein [Candidatus Nanopelagicales bacterium]|nr:enoyl-CoA hydratase/isomerase family protein [Candidatus Nanopelagicales bacterium]